ncbi:MAG: hypothetical protein R3C44_18555 [Chloroflexota bacterium]
MILFQGDTSSQGEDHSLEMAKSFVYRLSLRLLQEAPGLNLYAAHSNYTWGGEEALPTVVDAALKELGQLKGQDPGSEPALGWPVTAACTSTGLPANGAHPDTQGKIGSASRANRQVNLKWNAHDEATDRLRSLFSDIGSGKEFDWTDNFDSLADLPGHNDSYIAVVHADGNGMGARIKALTDEWGKKPKESRAYIQRMRELSNRVQETAQDALKRTVKALMDHLGDYEGPGPKQHPTDETEEIVNGKSMKKTQKYLPVRPIVFGGDDVTLVCAGPWGLAIAQRYLQELEEENLGADKSDKPYACAGVAIVKTHYPFSQAYGLSAELIGSAKERAKDLADKKASALDWYYTTTGLTGDLKRMREREYKVPTGELNMTPIMLHGDYKEGKYTWRNWDNFEKLMDTFGPDGKWTGQHNKTMRLREALRGGPDEVQKFEAIYVEKPEQSLPGLTLSPSDTLTHGWVKSQPLSSSDDQTEGHCAYFDAIEIAGQF